MDLTLAAELCRQFEGFRSLPYLCPANVPTIGYGSTYYADGEKVTLSDPSMTRKEAEKLLLHELEVSFAPSVARLCPELFADAVATGEWNRFNAIVDFTFNLGGGRLQTSTLRRKIRARDWEGAKQQLLLWTRGGGRVLPGLVKRRKAECALM